LRLVHDHLAKVPTAPADLNPRMPRGLSDIVMRLLEKDPDSRYQSAEGLAYDLVMVRDTLDAGPGHSLVFGTRDFPQQLPSPTPMVDRRAELETLRAQFAAAMHGPDRGILIVGAQGIGKGALVEQLRPTVNGNGGWMVTGRSDQYRQDSQSDAVWQALRALGRCLVTESEEDLAAHRKNIRNALGRNAGLIANILPEFGLLLKVTPDPAASQDPMAERRLQQSSVDLVRTILSTGRPLVLVLDDLQWAGPTALGVIDGLLTDHSLRGLLVVGTYRDAEVTPTHPLSTMLSRWRSLHPAPPEIRLSDLSAEDLVTFVQEMLRLPWADAAELAQAIGVRSHGNPYDTVELINALRGDGALVQQEGGWCWDAEGLRRYIGHGDVEDLLATRLDALAPQSVGLLDVMACVGDTAEVTLLADASGEPLSIVEQLLAEPLADGLVDREDTGEPTWRFRHDRVRQVVSGRLTPAQRTDIHRTVARRLAPIGQFATVAAEQYLAAIDTIHEPDEIRRVVDLLRRACRDVRPVNPATAERCLSSAIGLLRKIQTPADTNLFLALQTEEHSVLSLLGRHDDVDQVFGAIQRVNPDPQQLADAVCVQVGSLCDRGREAEGVELGLDLLRRLGLDVPREPVGLPTEQQWAQLVSWVAGLDLAEDLRRPEVRDPRELAIAQVIEGLTTAAFFSDPAAVAWLVFESQRLWVKNGPSRSLAATLGLAGTVTIALRRDYRIGYPILRHLLAVCEARDYEPATSFVRGCMSLFTSHWFEPLEDNVEQGLLARDGLMKAGLMQSVCYTYYATMGALLDTAPSIDALDDEVEPAITLALSTGNSHAVAGFIGYRQLLRAMRGQTDGPGSFSDSSFDETSHLNGVNANPIDVCLFRISRSLAAAIFGDLPTLIEQSSATMRLAVGQGGYRESVAHLFQALALAQRIRTDPRQAPDAMLAEIDTCRQWLSERAVDAPFNYLHMVRLVDAERAWAVGDTTAATAAFDAALTESENRSRPWHRALIAERAALHHLDHGLEYHGRILMIEARRRYDAWGATAKVAQLDRTYPFLRGSLTTGRDRGHDLSNIVRVTPDTTLVTSDALDLLGLLQASQALSSERSLDRLRARVVETLSEMTGATSVQVLMWDDDIADWVKPADVQHGSSFPVEQAAANGLLPLSA
ncbi:MAG: hypothetical protein QOI26_1356, partial [Pseudonocardiales bacterium]|nr:hypothetical protein [Pseudonocardiales bacterium]